MRADPSPGRVRASLLLLLALGILARGLAVWLAPQRSYLPDHLDNMAWSDYAFTNGPQRIYDFAELTPYLVRYRTEDGAPADSIMLVPHACNYPPLSAFVFWFQGAVWHAVDGDVRTVDAQPGLPFAQVTSRTLDTPTARAVQALPACLFDIPLALGVAALVAQLRGASRWGSVELAGAGLTFLAPPIFINSAFWGQADSWITCWLVWTIVALLRRRLVLGGVLFGAALMTKPQAILLAPVLLFWLASLRWGDGGGWRRAAGIWKPALAATLAVGVIAAPFMLADRAHAEGAFRWFKRSYAATVGAEVYERTTLNAFNIWWLDWLSGEPTNDRRASDAELLGTTKKTVGLALLGAAVIASGTIVVLRRGFTNEATVAFTALTLLAAFAFPTAVHERYIYYCLPFFVALAVLHPRLWSGPLAVLLVVATAEMTAFLWVGRAESPWVRVISCGMAVATLLTFLSGWAILGATRRRAEGVRSL